MTSPTQERFSRLPIPIHKISAKSTEDLFNALPGLRRYFNNVKSFDGDIENMPIEYRACWFGPTLVSILKYIIFVYDPDSDLVYEYSEDPNLMKDAAAKEAGFKRDNKGNWPDWLVNIMEFRDKMVIDWILDYLRVRNNKIWSEIKFIEEEIEFLNRSRAQALAEGKLRSDAMEQTRKRTDELQTLYKRFYAEHNDLKKATEEEIYPVSPENVFKELKIPEEIWKVRQIKDVPKEARPQ